MKLNCVITDDEPVAQEILQDYLRMVPGLHHVASCKNVMETYTVLRNNEVDVLFIDIQMPEMSGVEFIRSLTYKPSIVFTTAYPNYAIEGFELDAVDYLLKPISFDRFLRTIDKLYMLNKITQQETAPQPTQQKKYFFVKSNQELIKIEFSKILYIEGMENYVRIHCENKTIVSFCTMKYMEEMLAAHSFLRIHRSYIVNLDKVDFVQDHTVSIHDEKIVIGKSYKKSVAEILKRYHML